MVEGRSGGGGRSTPRWRDALLAALVLVSLLALHPPGREYDFCTYYTGGLLLRDGEPAAAFDAEALNRRHEELHPDTGRRYGVFLYSPAILLPSATMTWLPFRVAEGINHLATAAALASLAWLCLGRTRRPAAKLLVAAAFVLAHPVAIQFDNQNWSFLLVAAVAAAWWAGRRGWTWPAACAWALAVHLKPYAGLFLLALLFAGRRRLVVAAAGATAALAALATPFVGWRSWVAWGGALAELSAGGVVPFHNKISLPAAAARHLTPAIEWFRPTGPVDHPAVVWLGPALLALALVALAWLSRDEERALAWCIPAVLLAVPQVWEHTALLLVLLLATPAFPRRARVALAAVLVASVVYRPVVLGLTEAVLWGGGEPALLEAVLWFYPGLALGVALALLLARPADPG